MLSYDAELNDATVENRVADATANKDLVQLKTGPLPLPWLLGGAGLIVLIGGIVLGARSVREQERAADIAEDGAGDSLEQQDDEDWNEPRQS